jgi:hypothetical protein
LILRDSSLILEKVYFGNIDIQQDLLISDFDDAILQMGLFGGCG